MTSLSGVKADRISTSMNSSSLASLPLAESELEGGVCLETAAVSTIVLLAGGGRAFEADNGGATEGVSSGLREGGIVGGKAPGTKGKRAGYPGGKYGGSALEVGTTAGGGTAGGCW